MGDLVARRDEPGGSDAGSSATSSPALAGVGRPGGDASSSELRSQSKQQLIADDGAAMPPGVFRAVVLAVPYLEQFFDQRLPQSFFLTKGRNVRAWGMRPQRAICSPGCRASSIHLVGR